MNKFSILAIALAAAVCGSANASVIQAETASGTTPFLGSASAYQAAVNAALAGPSYQSASVASLDSYSHGSVFGFSQNFALKTTVHFGVTDAEAGNFSFRGGVDLGMGGAMYLDGVALDFKGNDMWWAGSYSNPSQFLAGSAMLAGGNHVLQIMGFEGCCDGGAQVQFARGANGFTSFSNADGLSAIPEPTSISLALAGVALLGLSRRRKAGQA